MRFDYDSAKSESNLEKHGIDFEEAQELWDDPHMIAVRVSKHGEKRIIGIARMAGSYWTAVWTERGDAVRIISVRRSTAKEASNYDKTNR